MALIIIVLSLIACVILLVSYLVFHIIFYVPSRIVQNADEIILPPGRIYEPFYNQMRDWVIEARNTPYENVSILSYDGLRLSGKYYEYAPGAPVELMFHGYRGSAERDLAGGMHRAFKLGHSALIVDQRTAGGSEGNVISFGINEHRDCLRWLEFVINYLGSDCKIILQVFPWGHPQF